MKKMTTPALRTCLRTAIYTAVVVAGLAASPAYAECKYVTVNGKYVYVCDNRNGQRCGYVTVDGKSRYVCN